MSEKSHEDESQEQALDLDIETLEDLDVDETDDVKGGNPYPDSFKMCACG